MCEVHLPGELDVAKGMCFSSDKWLVSSTISMAEGIEAKEQNAALSMVMAHDRS